MLKEKYRFKNDGRKKKRIKAVLMRNNCLLLLLFITAFFPIFISPFLCSALFSHCFTDYELYEVWKRNLENKLINGIVCGANNTVYCLMDLNSWLDGASLFLYLALLFLPLLLLFISSVHFFFFISFFILRTIFFARSLLICICGKQANQHQHQHHDFSFLLVIETFAYIHISLKSEY